VAYEWEEQPVSVYQVVTLRAAEGRADELEAMLRAGRQFALSARGCEAFDVYRSSDVPGQFAMVEQWATAEQHASFFQENVVDSGVGERVDSLLSEPRAYGYFERL
jgi:quinol monooxygenase YgiN